MKISKGIPLITVLVLLLIAGIATHLLNFFQSFTFASHQALTLAFLVVVVILTSFAVGAFIIFLFLQPWVMIGEFILSLSLINIFLIILALIAAYTENFFKIIALIVAPLFLFHLFILGFFLLRFFKRHTSFQPQRLISLTEKRGSTRIKDSLSAEYLWQDTWCDAKVIDVSATGVRILTNKALEKDKEMELKLFLPYDAYPVYVKARIVWINAVYPENHIFQAGMQFIKIDPADRLRLTLTNLFQRKVV